MNDESPTGPFDGLPETTAKRRWKTVADLLPAIGFFGVFLLFGRDMILATTGLLCGLIAQLVIYKLIRQAIPTWMKILTVIAFVFAVMTLLFRDPDFIKIRSSITGFLVGCFFVGSVLIRKNVLQLILGKMMLFPQRTWNVITVLWSLPIFVNAGLNLIIANQLPWLSWEFSDDAWMGYRFVSGFVVTGASILLVIVYLVATKQKPKMGGTGNAVDES